MTFNATPPTQTYTYDQENRLIGAAGYAYTYDGDGNRVRKSNGNLAANGTLYWAMTPGVVAETDLAGTLKSEYVFFDGERVARRDGPTGTGGVFYYFSDHLKTASVITDSAGVIKAESDYYPWGGELQFVNNDSNDYKFTGKKRDIETGLDYFGARYYSNGLGRWVSADWSATPVPVPYADFGDPQTLNLYGFVGGNPASKADPDGHCPDGGCTDYLTVQQSTESMNFFGQELIGIGKGVVNFLPNLYNGIVSALNDAPAAHNQMSYAPTIPLNNTGEEVGSVVITLGLSAYLGQEKSAPQEDPVAEPYNRQAHYGNPATSRAAKDIRAAGEGQPCSRCNETMKSGTKNSPTAQHNPTLKSHYYRKGHRMTAAERRAYARTAKSMEKKAVCKPCQSKEGAAEAKRPIQWK
jgi:RHS repeat-associated protein